MIKAIAIWLIGTPVAFIAAFQIVAFVSTGQINPLITHDEYVHLRGLSFLLFFGFAGLLVWAAVNCIDRDFR